MSASGSEDVVLTSILPTPTIVTLCGSSRFKETFFDALQYETLAGHIVILPGVFGKVTVPPYPGELSRLVKARLDVLHLAKIDIADEVLVIDVDGYIGESTEREICYAELRGKPVRYWSKEREQMTS